MVPLAGLILRKNPLMPHDYEAYPLVPGERPIDWLQRHHPRGFGAKVWHYHNDELLAAPTYDRETGEELTPGHPEYLDRPVAEGDVVQIVVWPGEFISTTMIITAIVTAIVSAALSIGLSLLFRKPQAPLAAQQDGDAVPSPVYNLRSRQNIARLGEPVPAVYGRVLMTPDLCAQPYSIYEGRGMYIDQLMCLGHSGFVIHDVIVGETSSDRIENAGLQYIVVPPSLHGGVFGNLNAIAVANGWGGGFLENAVTSLEVGEQRFTAAGDESGWYQVGRAGIVVGSVLYISIEFPRGLFQMPDWGSPTGTVVNFDVYADECDANGDPIPGTRQTFFFSLNGAEIDPRRDTLTCNLGRNGAWLVKMHRYTAATPNGEEMNEWFWRSLTLACTHLAGTAYGDTWLLMVRLRADEVARSASRLVRVDCTRYLPLAGATTNPADAFIDILTNPAYGGRRPLDEIDLAKLAQLRPLWAPYGFNAAYTQRTTVWEALTQCLQGVAAVPLPIDGAMTVAQDGVRPARSMLFTEQNIVKGTFQLQYHFEETGAADGVEIEYVNPDTWSPEYVRFPPDSDSPERINLFGCSNAGQAWEIARLQWQRRQRLRRLVTFQTEMEGLIPMPGERIAVAHTLPRWGVSGLVASVAADGVNITLDRPLPWDEVDPPWYMMFRDQYSGASAIVQAFPGSSTAQAVLSGSPWGPGQDWMLGPTQERTHFTWGDGERVIKDFTLTIAAPKSTAVVEITGVVYDENVYFGSLPFLSSPVP